jgi:hypothetical protein
MNLKKANMEHYLWTRYVDRCNRFWLQARAHRDTRYYYQLCSMGSFVQWQPCAVYQAHSSNFKHWVQILYTLLASCCGIWSSLDFLILFGNEFQQYKFVALDNQYMYTYWFWWLGHLDTFVIYYCICMGYCGWWCIASWVELRKWVKFLYRLNMPPIKHHLVIECWYSSADSLWQQLWAFGSTF